MCTLDDLWTLDDSGGRRETARVCVAECVRRGVGTRARDNTRQHETTRDNTSHRKSMEIVASRSQIVTALHVTLDNTPSLAPLQHSLTLAAVVSRDAALCAGGSTLHASESREVCGGGGGMAASVAGARGGARGAAGDLVAGRWRAQPIDSAWAEGAVTADSSSSVTPIIWE